MTHPRLFALALALVCLPALAAPPNPPKPPQFPGLRQPSAADLNSPRMQAARQWAMAAILGDGPTPADMDRGDWEPHSTLFVGCSHTPPSRTYPDIQSAVIAAHPYTRILVCRGTYSGNVTVNTGHLAIEGVGDADDATISCTQNGNGIDVNASYNRIRKLTFTNCYVAVGFNYSPIGNPPVQHGEVSHSIFRNSYAAILSDSNEYIHITDNHFVDGLYAVELSQDSFDTVSGNDIGVSGPNILGAYGIGALYSVGLQVRNNNIRSNYFGLYLVGSSDSAVKDNHLEGNQYGIDCYGTEDNTYRDNTAKGGQYGFYLDTLTGADDTAVPNPLPDRIIDNEAFGNAIFDYFDATYPYAGGARGTNAGTANHYDDDRGKTASPPAILTR